MNTKFGKLISENKPVVLFFYCSYSTFDAEHPEFHKSVRHISQMYGDKIKVVKLDKNKNEEIFQALRIKTLPTCLVYMNGSMDFRQDKVFRFSSLDDYLINIFHKSKVES